MPHGYAVSSFGGGVYALVLTVLFAVSVGDVARQFNLAAWFSWHVVYVAMMVCDSSSLRPMISPDARRWHRFSRQIASIVAGFQALGFFVWVLVEWASGSHASSSSQQTFYALATVTLGVAMVVVWATFYAVLGTPIRSPA